MDFFQLRHYFFESDQSTAQLIETNLNALEILASYATTIN